MFAQRRDHLKASLHIKRMQGFKCPWPKLKQQIGERENPADRRQGILKYKKQKLSLKNDVLHWKSPEGGNKHHLR